jgi:hypothetical protein
MHSGLLSAIFWQVVDVLKGSKQKRHREGYSLSLVLQVQFGSLKDSLQM